MHFPYVPSDIDAVVFDIGGVFTVRDGDLFRDGMARAGFTVAADQESFVRAHYLAAGLSIPRCSRTPSSETIDAGCSVAPAHDRRLWTGRSRRLG